MEVSLAIIGLSAKLSVVLAVKSPSLMSTKCTTAMVVVPVEICNQVMFNHSQAHCFFGQDLLVQEKCGDSVKALQHSNECKFLPFCSFYTPCVIVSPSVHSSRETVCSILTHEGSGDNCPT